MFTIGPGSAFGSDSIIAVTRMIRPAHLLRIWRLGMWPRVLSPRPGDPSSGLFVGADRACPSDGRPTGG